MLPKVIVFIVFALLNVAPTYADSKGDNEPQPVIFYYGEQITRLDVDKILAERDIYCVQEITANTVVERHSESFVCFNTEAEMQIQRDRNQPYLDEIFATSASRKVAAQWVPHWALYWNTFYNGHFLDLACGATTSISNTSFYSAWNDSDPRHLRTESVSPNRPGVARIEYATSFAIPMYAPITYAALWQC